MATASCEFQMMAKPVGALSNLEYRYYYYLAKRHPYPEGESFRMPEELLDPEPVDGALEVFENILLPKGLKWR